MSIGYWLVKGDKTTCGGVVLDGSPYKKIGPRQLLVALVGSPVSCGKHPGTYSIAGGFPGDVIHGTFAASTLYSRSTCPCQALFIPSQTWMSHGRYQGAAAAFTPELSSRAGSDTSSKTLGGQLTSEPAQFAQTVKSNMPPPKPLPLPALIYQTVKEMDDYQADDMKHGDLDILTLRNRFRINVDEVSTKVNPHTLKLKNPADPFAYYSPYVHPEFQPKAMNSVSREESAALMFDEFRELAKMFSFHGEYQDIITDMITHMQKNTGEVYRNPLLDKALKEQILNDHSEKSTLLKIKDILKKTLTLRILFILQKKKGNSKMA